jgi:hypothetical protein
MKTNDGFDKTERKKRAYSKPKLLRSQAFERLALSCNGTSSNPRDTKFGAPTCDAIGSS